jgi:hypothetical protein
VIGSVPESRAGNYTLRWTPGREYPRSAGNADLTIDSPVAYGYLEIRVVVRNNGTDLAQGQKIINECNLAKAEHSGSTHSGIPPLNLSQFANISTASTPVAILDLTARTLKACPPYNVTNPGAVIRELAAAGVSEGSYKPLTGVNLTAATDSALESLLANNATFYRDLNDGWSTLKLQSFYGSDYAARAYTARAAPLPLQPSEALYPVYDAAHYSLTADEAYIFTFLSKPPLGPSGFWSLTMYNASSYLVANPEDIYAVGDSSNITYPDGSLVYGAGSSSTNESFQVLVQSSSPPSNWTHK